MSKEKPLNIANLNATDRECLENILSKDLNDLTVYDLGFLRARRDYLSAEQREYFTDALNGKLKGKDYVAEETEEKVSKTPEKPQAVKSDKKRVISTKEYNHATLVQMAKDAELEFDEKTTDEQLAAMLTELVNK